MRIRRQISLVIIAGMALFLSGAVLAHSGGKDENGGHVDRSTGEYHCHDPECVLPTVAAPPDSISVVSFNIQFLAILRRGMMRSWLH